jgi:hypothetical protein
MVAFEHSHIAYPVSKEVPSIGAVGVSLLVHTERTLSTLEKLEAKLRESRNRQVRILIGQPS